MELWIPITIAAAFLQNLRSVFQKQLKSRMGTTGATFTRFGFGLPFALLFVAVLHFGAGYAVPAPNGDFLFWVAVSAVSQIAATFLLVHLFSYRNFAVGNAYARTEPVQTAFFALVLFGEQIAFGTWFAIGVSVAGVMVISVAHTRATPLTLVTSVFQRHALIGLASGACFGLSGVAYRGASLALGGPNFMMQAATTLAWSITLQTLLMAGWMAWRERDQFGKIVAAWRPGLAAGATGATASFGWLLAMTLQQAAMVKALGQIEMLFSFFAAVVIFSERINRREVMGCALIATGIVFLLLLPRG